MPESGRASFPYPCRPLHANRQVRAPFSHPRPGPVWRTLRQYPWRPFGLGSTQMNGKLTLSFSVATFIAALAAMYFLSEVRVRLRRLETRQANADAVSEGSPATRGTNPAAGLGGSGNAADAEGDPVAPLDSKDPIVKLDSDISQRATQSQIIREIFLRTI